MSEKTAEDHPQHIAQTHITCLSSLHWILKYLERFKHTQKKGQELGLKGWCMNTDKGTVVGQLEGEEKKVEEMKKWLQYTGSPQSAIDKTVFQNEKEITSPSFTSFDIRK